MRRSAAAASLVTLEFEPGRGSARVTISSGTRAEVPGADFAAALPGLWLGASPVGDDLQSALLGP